MPKPEEYVAVGTEIGLRDTERPEWEKVLARMGNRKVLGLKCYTDHERDEDGNVLIYRPAYGSHASVEYCMFVQILMVSDKCVLLSDENVGDLIEVPEHNRRMNWISDDYVVFDERAISDPQEHDTQVIKPYVVKL